MSEDKTPYKTPTLPPIVWIKDGVAEYYSGANVIVIDLDTLDYGDCPNCAEPIREDYRCDICEIDWLDVGNDEIYRLIQKQQRHVVEGVTKILPPPPNPRSLT